jgi:VWFA-related protein
MRTLVSLSMASFFSLWPLASAQQTASQAQVAPSANVVSPASADDHRVWLDVVVTDKAGNPVSGLQQQDFTLLDDKQPRSITSFQATPGADGAAEPLQAIFLVDAVNTGYQSVQYEESELKKFLRRDGGQLVLPTSLVLLTDTATKVQPVSTRDGNSLVSSLDSAPTGLRAVNRSQGFYGAVERVQISLGTLAGLASYEATQPGRKLLVWLSPGWPLLSGPGIQVSSKDQDTLFRTAVDFSRHLREARITLYSVDPLGTGDAGGFQTFYYESFLKGVPSSRKMESGNLALQVLATQSGGRVLNSSNDVAKLIASCIVDAKAYYTLSFDAPPADHPDEYHALEVKIDKPKLLGRTRTGYYAQPYRDAGR